METLYYSIFLSNLATDFSDLFIKILRSFIMVYGLNGHVWRETGWKIMQHNLACRVNWAIRGKQRNTFEIECGLEKLISPNCLVHLLTPTELRVISWTRDLKYMHISRLLKLLWNWARLGQITLIFYTTTHIVKMCWVSVFHSKGLGFKPWLRRLHFFSIKNVFNPFSNWRSYHFLILMCYSTVGLLLSLRK